MSKRMFKNVTPQYTTKMHTRVNTLLSPKDTSLMTYPARGASTLATITMPGNICTHRSQLVVKPQRPESDLVFQSSGPPAPG